MSGGGRSDRTWTHRLRGQPIFGRFFGRSAFAAPNDCALMREEIFGPVLPVAWYDDLADVAEQIEQTGKPLATDIFSPDQAFVDEVLERTSSAASR